MTLKRYNLYTFTKSKFIYTETENVKQALNNFNRRLNINHNGYYHPDMQYNFNPISVLTRSKNDNEKILSYNIDELRKEIIREE